MIKGLMQTLTTLILPSMLKQEGAITSPTIARPVIKSVRKRQPEETVISTTEQPQTASPIVVLTPEYLPFSQLYEYLLSQEVGYLVKDHTTELKRVLVICGMWRMTKINKTGKLQYHRLKVTHENGEYQSQWVRTKKVWVLPLFTFTMASSFFSEIRGACLDMVLKDLGKCHSLSGFQHKDVNFSIKNKPERSRLYSLLSNKLQYRVDNTNKEYANRALIKSVWAFIDNRAAYKLYYRIHYLRYSDIELPDIHFKCIHDFAQHDISAQYWEENKSLAPLLRFIDSKHYPNKQLFSNKQLVPLLATTITPLRKNDLRSLRGQPITLVKTFCHYLDKFSDNIRGDYNYNNEAQYYQSKAMGDVVIQNAFKLFRQYIHSPELTRYPTTIRCELLTRLSDDLYQFASESLPVEPLLTLYTAWAVYHQGMVKNVKPKKQSEQWDRAINHLRHVVDWYKGTRPQLHKNQTWTSFQQLSDTWTHNLHQELASEIEDIRWTKRLTSDMTVNVKKHTVTISELNTALELHTEGLEQNHCVYSYHQYCVNGDYSVFSLKEFDEDGTLVNRATLGVDVNLITNKLTYDQLQTAGNGLPPPYLKQLAKKLIIHLNNGALAHE